MTTYQNYLEIVEAAQVYAESKGFSYATSSSLSEAAYLTYPGREGHLRIAMHPCRHPCEVYATANLLGLIREITDEFGDEEYCVDDWRLYEAIDDAIVDFFAAAPAEDTE